MNEKKETIVTGIQPTGALHVGHFLGLLRNYVEDLQNEYKGRCFLFTADYHSMNEPDIFANYSTNRIELATELLALGFDPKKVTMFHLAQTSLLKLAFISSKLPTTTHNYM